MTSRCSALCPRGPLGVSRCLILYIYDMCSHGICIFVAHGYGMGKYIHGQG